MMMNLFQPPNRQLHSHRIILIQYLNLQQGKLFFMFLGSRLREIKGLGSASLELNGSNSSLEFGLPDGKMEQLSVSLSLSKRSLIVRFAINWFVKVT